MLCIFVYRKNSHLTVLCIMVMHMSICRLDSFDLESVAALSFKDKQLWLLDRIADLQIPFSKVRTYNIFNACLYIQLIILFQVLHKVYWKTLCTHIKMKIVPSCMHTYIHTYLYAYRYFRACFRAC